MEGHGDYKATPILIRRVASEIAPEFPIEIPQPVRVPRSKLTKTNELEKAVLLAVNKALPHGAVLILADSDDDPPCLLGPELLKKAMQIRPDVPIGVALAQREFESWFLAAAQSLQGKRSLPKDLEPPPEPEAIRNAKQWLDGRMGTQGYSETVDQPALTAVFDLTLARRSRSFDKCYREIERLVRILRERS